MDKIQLFVYGTIGDAEIFERLLKRKPKYRPALLKDYQLFIHPGNAYLFVKPVSGETVGGKIVEIDANELMILDYWEDLPLYARELLEVETEGLRQKAFVYTQNDTVGIPAKQGHVKDREKIMAEIDEFLKWVDTNFQ